MRQRRITTSTPSDLPPTLHSSRAAHTQTPEHVCKQQQQEADETHWPFTAPPFLSPPDPLRLQQQAQAQAERDTARETLSRIRTPPYLVLTGRATSVRQIRRRLLGSAAAIGGQRKRIGDWGCPMYVHTDSTTTWQYFFSLNGLRWPAWPRRSGLLYFMLCCSSCLYYNLSPFLSFFLPLLRCPSLL